MRARWHPAFTTLAGLVATALALRIVGPAEASMVALATLSMAMSSRSIIGTAPVPSGTDIDPRVVRQYREAHPGTSISESIAIVARR